MSDPLERLVDSFVVRAPGWLVGSTAVVLYAGVGLALPLALDWPKVFLVEANAVGTVLAVVVLLAWFILQIEASHRRHLLEWTSNLRLLNAAEFEWLVGEVFRREGWTVTETGGIGLPDGNIDLELRQGAQRRIVQCKRWDSRPVGVDEIRRFGGTLMREKLDATKGVFVTLSSFTEAARLEASAMGVEILDNRNLVDRIEKVRRSEPCPNCATPMILAKSDYGWWLRCHAPGCSGKRDLGRDPGRVVQFLVDEPAR